MWMHPRAAQPPSPHISPGALAQSSQFFAFQYALCTLETSPLSHAFQQPTLSLYEPLSVSTLSQLEATENHHFLVCQAWWLRREFCGGLLWLSTRGSLLRGWPPLASIPSAHYFASKLLQSITLHVCATIQRLEDFPAVAWFGPCNSPGPSHNLTQIVFRHPIRLIEYFLARKNIEERSYGILKSTSRGLHRSWSTRGSGVWGRGGLLSLQSERTVRLDCLTCTSFISVPSGISHLYIRSYWRTSWALLVRYSFLDLTLDQSRYNTNVVSREVGSYNY